MAYISVPNVIVNGNVCDATELNQNFDALVNGLQDGTKDINVLAVAANAATITNTLTIGAGATVAGTLTVSGMLHGTRSYLVWTGNIEGNVNGYISPMFDTAPGASTQWSIPCITSGSIIGLSTIRYMSACANAQTLTPQIRNAATGGVILAASTLTISASVTGLRTGVVSTFTRDDYTFTAGVPLAVYVVTSGTAGSAAMAGRINVVAEVVFNN